MSRDEKIDPKQPDNKSEVLPSSPRDPIEPDPMNPAPEPPSNVEPEGEERPDLDWVEHED